MKIISRGKELSTLDQIAITQLLPYWQQVTSAMAPPILETYINDLLKQNRADVNAWLAQHGYEYQPAATTASETTASTTGKKNGDLIQVTNPRGGTVNRYLFIDDSGDQWGLVTKGDQTTADYLYSNGNWEYVDTDAEGRIIAPANTTLSNKYYDTITGSWKDMASTDPFAGLSGSTTPDAYTEAQTKYLEAQTQQLLQQINNPNSSNDERNAAAVQLYGIMSSMANQNNANNFSQWGNQAGAFNQAYQNAIEQNKWIQDMSTSPLNTVAYLNLIRGQNPPDWQIPNYQQMPDAFQGWNQLAPTNQGVDMAALQDIFSQLWGNQQTQNTTGWANGVNDPNQNQYQTVRDAYPQYSEADLNKYFAPLTPEQQAQSQASYNATLSPETSSYLAQLQASRNQQTPNKGYTQTDYGSTGTVQDTLAVLREANPGVNYYVGADGMIKVG